MNIEDESGLAETPTNGIVASSNSLRSFYKRLAEFVYSALIMPVLNKAFSLGLPF